MKRCHKCLSKITPDNPADTVNKWGKEECNKCAECSHGVKLNATCTQCDDDVLEMLALQNEAESGECFTCGKNFLLVEDAMTHIVECRKTKQCTKMHTSK